MITGDGLAGAEGGPPSETVADADGSDRAKLSARAALLVFAIFVAVALPLVLFNLGSYHWFFEDDWFFIVDRDLTSIDDLFRPHNAHWSTVPVIAFRALWKLFGLRSYVPYQACVVILHLSAVVLLRVIMRRAGVGPWVATAAASTLVLFGAGSQNIVWAFQIGYTSSLVFGLVHLLLVDHDGPVGRRDWIGLVAGTLALMSSGVGVTMVVVVGIAALLRRGWRVAMLHTAPLAALFGIYTVVEDPEVTTILGRPTADVVVDWVISGEIGTFLALGRFQVVGIALAIMLGVGLVLVLTSRQRREQVAAPAALLVGGVVFSAITAQGRWFLGAEGARSSRYVYLGAAFTLPALALAADAIARRWRLLTPVLVALFLVAIPANASDFGLFPFGPRYFDTREQLLTTAVRMPFAREVPRDVRPVPDASNSTDLTIGFLLDAKDAGKLPPSSGPVPRNLVNELKVRLGVAQTLTEPSLLGCRKRAGPVDVSPPVGTVFTITGPVKVSTRTGSERTSPPVLFVPADGQRLTVVLGGLDLRFENGRGRQPFVLCQQP